MAFFLEIGVSASRINSADCGVVGELPELVSATELGPATGELAIGDTHNILRFRRRFSLVSLLICTINFVLAAAP